MRENVLERLERIGAKQKMADFQVKMQMPYEFKKKYAMIRAREYDDTWDITIHCESEEDHDEVVRILSEKPEIIRCKECDKRNTDECPMRHVEWRTIEDDGYLDMDDVVWDLTEDDGYCDRGRRRDE